MNTKTDAAGGDTPAGRVRVAEHTLIEPIDGADGARITKVLIRRPKARDIREMERINDAEGPGPAAFRMVAALTGLTDDQVDDLDGEDFVELSEKVANFIPARKTGER